MSLLEIHNLQVTFGGLDALSNLDFSIEAVSYTHLTLPTTPYV